MKISSLSNVSWTNHLEAHHPKKLSSTQLPTSRPLTTLELCDFLQAPKSTIDQYNREGMPRFFVGKQCRYIPNKVLAWLERRSQDRVCPAEETFDLGKELNL